MAVPAAGRCVCVGWPRGGGPPPGLPVVCRAAGVLVWLLAACPGGGPLPEDLRAQGALRPAFVLAWRLDVAEAVGVVIGQVAGGACGVRPAAARAGVPHTTARGWVRRFGSRAGELGAAFAALAVDLGGEAICPPAEAGRFALTAITAAFAAAADLPGWVRLGVWRFAASVSGGRLIAPST